MKSPSHRFLFRSWCLLAALAGSVQGQSDSADGPIYGGRPLSAWADQVLALDRLATIVNTNANLPEVQALRALGTNAIPWLLAEFKRRPAETNREQPPTWVGLPVGSETQYHALRARACFWALGEKAQPAIPGLVALLDQQPDLVPSALAGIGAPALPALEACLTNVPPKMPSSATNALIVAGALGGLYVAIDVGRIRRPEAEYLLPLIQAWAQVTNDQANYWANGALRKFRFEH
jgi:hypothetical protein